MDLQTPVGEARKSLKLYAKRLEKLGIYKLEDFLYHIPSRYEDYSIVSKINELQAGETVTIKATVKQIQNQYLSKWKTLQKAIVADETGEIEVTWFNQPFLTKTVKEGSSLSLSGTVHAFRNKLSLQSPDYEVVDGQKPTLHTARLVPVYSETKGVTSKWLRRQVYSLLQKHKTNITEYLPQTIIEKENLMELSEALSQIHFPDSLEMMQKAKNRLAFGELLTLQLAANSRRKKWDQELKSQPFTVTSYQNQIEQFFDKLPFNLTGAQKRAVTKIYKDLVSTKPMNRLLEGDVGSGKTVVAAIAMYLAYLNGYQSVLMAPTEILAQQHFNTISLMLFPFDAKIGLATGSRKIDVNDFDIMIGTHAVLSDKVNYKKLGLVIIDEQHRFGVQQRAFLRKKGEGPHLLTMTATPIPRTVALTLYGDLELSVLDELPKGRKNIKTWLVPPEKRQGAYSWIEQQIKETDSQAFIICPFVEESENMQTVKAATVEFERLQKDIFPNLKLGLLHGRMTAKQKDEELQKFKNKEFDILVSTPVVEVGIDIPNATIMMIEGAERFGLAQLHQLRGRVGRGEKQSYCLLFTETRSQDTYNRLKSLEKINQGAELAELDLSLRGPGQLYGTAQHGKWFLRFASFSDLPLIEKTKHDAEKLYQELDNYPLLKKKLQEIELKEISPD